MSWTVTGAMQIRRFCTCRVSHRMHKHGKFRRCVPAVCQTVSVINVPLARSFSYFYKFGALYLRRIDVYIGGFLF